MCAKGGSMTDRELLQQALDALQLIGIEYLTSKEIDHVGAFEVALRARLAQPEQEPEKSQDKPCVEDDGCPTEKAVLQRFWREHQAQPEQEPVAWADKVDIDRDGHDLWVSRQEPAKDGVPLYTAPPQREWVGLTREELAEIAEFHFHGALSGREFYDDIETRLKEKNT